MAIRRAKSRRKGTPVPVPVAPSEAQKRIFLEAYSEDLSVYDARKRAGFTRAELDDLMAKDPAFFAQMRAVTEDSIDRVEAAAFRRAVNFGDKDLIKLILQARRGKEYGPKASVTVNLTREQVCEMSDDELEKMYMKLSGNK